MSDRTAADYLALAEWRRRTAELYAAVRQADEPQQGWELFVRTRDALFKSHPQSPLSADQQAAFSALPYYAYDPRYRVTGQVEGYEPPAPAQAQERRLELGEDGLFRFKPVATVRFALAEGTARLTLFWIEGYGGGLFLPFKDPTNENETFGGGRYLYDTIKGADLGAGREQIILDFNFAYNPSCAYNPRWVCPLSPPENRLALPVRAGEKRFTGTGD